MSARFAFEGDITSLSPKQQEFLCYILEKRGYNGNKVEIEPVGKAGDNYAANVKRIIVHGNSGDMFKMIAKIAPVNEIARAVLCAALLFNNEIVMYTEVLPKFAELQRAADVPEDECIQYAKCYGVLREEPDELILLEDLRESNFEMLDRFESLSHESVKLVVKNFAILHAFSFVLKKKEPEVFEYFSTKLLHYFSILHSVPQFQDFLTSLENDTLMILDSEIYKKAIRNTVSQMGAISKKVLKMEAASRYTVIVQGDGWTNNIMFRLKGEDPVEATMIDYQDSRVTSPVVDLLYMIFSCTDHSTRLNHYYDWMDYYHSVLEKSLSNYGLKANYVYPRDQLDADLRRYSKISIGDAVMLSSVLIRRPEDAAKIKEAMESGVDPGNLKISTLDSQSVALFKKRIEGVVNSYREFGYCS